MKVMLLMKTFINKLKVFSGIREMSPNVNYNILNDLSYYAKK